MTNTVAVCVPTIPPRHGMLERALRSIDAQTRAPDQVVVTLDTEGHGAAATRNAAWRQTWTDWVAFLDDDDELLPHHLATLLDVVELRPDVDLVYPWFELPHGVDPLYTRRGGQLVPAFGVPFGPEQSTYVLTEGNFIPVTVLVRRALLEKVDGFPQPRSERWPHGECEDWGCWQDVLRVGARFEHVPVRTWVWHWHGRNTSGKPWRVA